MRHFLEALMDNILPLWGSWFLTELAMNITDNAISFQGTHMTDSVPSDWTDEKHHLFLESMETSFVSQMFDSVHSVGSCPRKENSSHTKLHGQSQSASHVHSRFGQVQCRLIFVDEF